MRHIVIVVLLLILAPLCFADSAILLPPVSNTSLHTLDRFADTPPRIANRPPVARIVRWGGRPAPTRIALGHPIDISAQNSYDPDGVDLTYLWTVSDWTGILYTSSDMTITIDPARTGNLDISLVVTDSQGAQSWPATHTMEAMDNETLRLDMEFSCEGDMNVDLRLCDAVGACCSDSNMSANHSCSFPQGGGTVVLPNTTTSCAEGNLETMIYPNAPDGVYWLYVIFTENCASWADQLITPICLGTGDSFVGIDMTLGTNSGPSYRLEETLIEKGETKSWPIYKTDGFWQMGPP